MGSVSPLMVLLVLLVLLVPHREGVQLSGFPLKVPVEIEAHFR